MKLLRAELVEGAKEVVVAVDEVDSGRLRRGLVGEDFRGEVEGEAVVDEAGENAVFKLYWLPLVGCSGGMECELVREDEVLEVVCRGRRPR